jgi:DNA-binding NarL/FixJ family response regulator
VNFPGLKIGQAAFQFIPRNMPDAIRVLIVDDHSLFRKGLRAVLEGQAGIDVIGEAVDGSDAITQALAGTPDIILMDINMPSCNGLQATRKIKSLLPHTKIVMLTISDTDSDLFEAIKNGADGYLLKDVDAHELPGLLQRSAGGEALLQGFLAAKILEEFRKGEGKQRPAQSTLPDLSCREQEVLKLVAKGSSNKDIARQLFISENTVKHHLSNILEKLHLQNRIQLAVYATESK